MVSHCCFAIPDSLLLRFGAVPACTAAASHWPDAAAPAPELLSPKPSALSASRRCSSSHCSRRSSFRASFSSSARSASARASSSALARSASALTRSSSTRLASASWLCAPRRAAGQNAVGPTLSQTQSGFPLCSAYPRSQLYSPQSPHISTQLPLSYASPTRHALPAAIIPTPSPPRTPHTNL